MIPTASAILTCHCGAVKEPGTLLNCDHLPAETEFCHCDACRHSTGAAFGGGIPLHHRPDSISKCAVYMSSTKVTRHFCRRCGCHCFVQVQRDGSWWASGAIVEQTAESKARREAWPSDLLKATEHYYIGDTIDYKVPARMAHMYDKDLPSYEADTEQPPLGTDDIVERSHAPAAADYATQLTAQCHCGNVALEIQRPCGEPSVPFVPTATRPKDKYLAVFCACRSCRLTMGPASLCPWVYVPVANVSAEGGPIAFGFDGCSLPAVHAYHSSDEVMRCFCKMCGASVFYWNASRPHIVDIAVGLLRAAEGSSASTWLRWHDEIVNGEERVDRSIAAALVSSPIP